MRVPTTSLYLLSSIAISRALAQATSKPEATADTSASLVAYWSPTTTLPPESIPTSDAHLELRAPPAAAAPAAAAPAVGGFFAFELRDLM